MVIDNRTGYYLTHRRYSVKIREIVLKRNKVGKTICLIPFPSVFRAS